MSWKKVLTSTLFMVSGVLVIVPNAFSDQAVIADEVTQFGCGVSTPSADSLARPLSGDAISYRWLSGLEPERISDSKLAIQAGSVVSYSGKLYSLKKRLEVDLSKATSGFDGGLKSGKNYFIYLIGGKSSDITGAFISPEIATTKVNSENPDTNFVRKLPWGFVAIDGKIPAFHLSFWPKPFTRYTMATQTGAWQALRDGTDHKFQPVDLSRWLPDNARLAYLLFEVSNSGSGDAYVRVSPEQGDGFILRGAKAGGGTTQLFMHQRVDSKRRISYRADPGVTLNIYVFGYSNTEPS